MKKSYLVAENRLFWVKNGNQESKIKIRFWQVEVWMDGWMGVNQTVKFLLK